MNSSLAFSFRQIFDPIKQITAPENKFRSCLFSNNVLFYNLNFTDHPDKNFFYIESIISGEKILIVLVWVANPDPLNLT